MWLPGVYIVLIPILEMELNSKSPNTFEATLASDTQGIGKAGDRVTMSLNSPNPALDAFTGAVEIEPSKYAGVHEFGDTTSPPARPMIGKTKGSFTMSATIQMDAEDSQALTKALNELAKNAPPPTISIKNSFTDICQCGHARTHHASIGWCVYDDCRCGEFAPP